MDKKVSTWIPAALAVIVLAVCGVGLAGVSGGVSFSRLSGLVVAGEVVTETNTERTAVGVGTLTHNERLDRAATLKAQDMLAHQYFAHRSPSGVTPWHWFSEAGYTYSRAGENLAVHFTMSEAVVRAWMESPSHRANIVNAAFTEIGVGMATGTFEGVPTTFVVQMFGTPRSTLGARTRLGGLGAFAGALTSAVDEEGGGGVVDVAPELLAYTEYSLPDRSIFAIGMPVLLFGVCGAGIYVLVRSLQRQQSVRTRSDLFRSIAILAGVLCMTVAFFTFI